MRMLVCCSLAPAALCGSLLPLFVALFPSSSQGDIDYMNQYEDFSWDPVNYPQEQVAAFAQKLHSNDQQYVVIVDPGIHNRTGYTPFDSGLEQGLFVMEGDNSTPYIGKVWPGFTAFPDFLNNKTAAWWQQQIATFLQGVPYDGLWSDARERRESNAMQRRSDV